MPLTMRSSSARIFLSSASIRPCTHSRISRSRLSQFSTVSTCEPSASKLIDSTRGKTSAFTSSLVPASRASHAAISSRACSRRSSARVWSLWSLRQPDFRLPGGGFQRGELLLQRAQNVRPFLQLAALHFQAFDLRHQRAPIEFLEASNTASSASLRIALLRRVPLPLQPVDAIHQRRAPGLHAMLFQFQRGDLLLVAPAEHESRAVVDAVAVVLLVALAAPLDLARARDGHGFAAELIERLAAGVVEARRQFGVQPVVEARLRLDRNLAHQRGGGQRRVIRRPHLEHAEVDQAPAEMRAIHPLRHPRIVHVAHQ